MPFFISLSKRLPTLRLLKSCITLKFWPLSLVWAVNPLMSQNSHTANSIAPLILLHISHLDVYLFIFFASGKHGHVLPCEEEEVFAEEHIWNAGASQSHEQIKGPRRGGRN